MAIDLQNPQNISTGWGAPPQFHAPEIGGLVGHILQNRILQKAQQDKEIADAIKQYQTQREDSAYTEALRNAGLTQGQDISGLGSKQATALATLVAANTKDTESDALKTAMAAYYNKLATTGGGGRGGSGKVWSDDLGGMVTPTQQFNALGKQAGILGKQAAELEQQQQDYGLPADVPGGFGYMKNPDGTLRYATTPAEQAKPDLVSPTDILKGITTGKPKWTGAIDPDTGQPTMPTFTPDVYKQRQAQSATRQQILAEQIRVQQRMLGRQGVRQADVDQTNQAQPDPSATPAPTATPPANPDVTITPTPPPSNTGTGHASDYGVKQNDTVAASRDAAAIGQLYQAADGSVKRRMD